MIQNFLSKEELQKILNEFQYEEKARKCTVAVILSYLIHSAANEWKSLRQAADVGGSIGLISVDHSSLSKHLKGLDYAILKRVMEVIIGKLNRAARRKLKLPKALLSIDSTTITVGKNRLPWALYHGERAGIKLHVGFTNETEMPLHVVEMTGLKHDGPIGKELEDKLLLTLIKVQFLTVLLVPLLTDILSIGNQKKGKDAFPVVRHSQWRTEDVSSKHMIIIQHFTIEENPDKGFFIRSTERVPCPCCSGLSFNIIGSRERKVRRDTGEIDRYVIRRLRCADCRKIHHELPNFIIPYKRYEAAVIEEGIWPTKPSVLPIDDSTMYRWMSWFYTLVEYWLFICQSLLIQFAEEAPGDDLSTHSLPVFQRIGQWFGRAAGWLGKLVHPVANHHFWIVNTKPHKSFKACSRLMLRLDSEPLQA